MLSFFKKTHMFSKKKTSSVSRSRANTAGANPPSVYVSAAAAPWRGSVMWVVRRGSTSPKKQIIKIQSVHYYFIKVSDYCIRYTLGTR